MHNQRDGHMQMHAQVGRVHYSPSSLDPASPRQDPKQGFSSFTEALSGNKLRVRAESFADHYSQARQFFDSQTEPEQNHIIAAFIFELSKVETKAVRERMVGQLNNVDPHIAKRVAAGLGMTGPLPTAPAAVAVRTDLPSSPALSIVGKAKPDLHGRMIGCLVADGSDFKLVAKLKAAAAKVKADLKVIAPKVGGVTDSDGKAIEADFQLAGGSSVLFDHVFLALSEEGASSLLAEASAVAWVHDAFQHLKVLGATSESKVLLDKAGVAADNGVLMGDDVNAFLKTAANGKIWSREPSVRTIY